jgi:CMP-N-acetylneuraminic acid synthetase
MIFQGRILSWLPRLSLGYLIQKKNFNKLDKPLIWYNVEQRINKCMIDTAVMQSDAMTAHKTILHTLNNNLLQHNKPMIAVDG